MVKVMKNNTDIKCQGHRKRDIYVLKGKLIGEICTNTSMNQ